MQPSRMWTGAAVIAMAAALVGCGGSDINFGPTPTPSQTTTPTPVSTATPTATVRTAAVGGLIVVNQDVRGNADDGLMPLPPEMLPPVGKGFDRGLGNADWVVDDGVISGSTTVEGRFSITGLTPGPHTIHVTKSVDGNLLELDLPIIVGDDGSAEVLAEVSWGLVRTTSTYTAGGAAMRAVYAPNGSHLITRTGQVAELGDAFRTLVDSDGDGHFDPQTGACDQLYRCDDNGGCGDPDHICMCIPSCPLCEDCPERACVSRASLMRPDCGPDGLCKAPPYQCNAESICKQPDDRCSCIASCPACDDCPSSACTAPCQANQPIDIVSVQVYGPSPLVVSQEGGVNASVLLSDGFTIDVMWLATWASSDAGVATVDSFGRITALAAGATNLTAALGQFTSAPFALTVVERPTLRHIYLQNASCYYPLAMRDDATEVKPSPPSDVGFLPPPSCQQVVRIGATLQFMAIGEFDTGYYQDISNEVTWTLTPADPGEVVKGLFTAKQAGEAQLTASLGAVESDPLAIKVVSHATVVALTVYPMNWGYMYIDAGPAPPEADAPCYECGYSLTLLRGDTVSFSATAHYDTGEWEDVTSRVTWRSSDAGVATIDAAGKLTTKAAGSVSVDAVFEDVTSAALALRVVDHATLQSLYAYQDGQDRAIAKGEQATFHANGYYDVGFNRDVTAEATWHSSDESVGGFDTPGIFTGRAAGTVTVWAELDGQQSTPVPIEVYATSELAYCDPTSINRSTWSDDFNRVTLESDCAAYTPPGVVALRFSVTETQRPGGIFDPCLDLYAYRGDTLVRTIREEGCGDPFVPVGAPARDEAVLKYQLSAFWDLKDSDGNTVAPGEYTIRGRFYLYYDPVVQIAVQVNGGS